MCEVLTAVLLTRDRSCCSKTHTFKSQGSSKIVGVNVPPEKQVDAKHMRLLEIMTRCPRSHSNYENFCNRCVDSTNITDDSVVQNVA